MVLGGCRRPPPTCPKPPPAKPPRARRSSAYPRSSPPWDRSKKRSSGRRSSLPRLDSPCRLPSLSPRPGPSGLLPMSIGRSMMVQEVSVGRLTEAVWETVTALRGISVELHEIRRRLYDLQTHGSLDSASLAKRVDSIEWYLGLSVREPDGGPAVCSDDSDDC